MRETLHNPSEASHRSARRTALWLALVASLFYLGFLALGVFGR